MPTSSTEPEAASSGTDGPDQPGSRRADPVLALAILTSERADLDDVRVCELADGIIQAQREEIDEMDWLIEDIARHGEVTTAEEAAEPPIPDFSQGTQREC